MRRMGSQTCHVHKAQPIRPDQTVDSVVIRIEETLPEIGDVKAAYATYEGDAVRLADALMDSLPGGTIDQLLAELLERRASLLRVRFPLTDGGPDGG